MIGLRSLRIIPPLPRREVRISLNNRNDELRQLLLLQDTYNGRSSPLSYEPYDSRGVLTLIQHGLRRTGSKEQHLIIRLGIILKPQTPKVRPALIMEIPKLHSVIVLIRDNLPQ